MSDHYKAVVADRIKRRRVGRAGPPPFIPTPEQQATVKVLAGMRMTQKEIALTIINPSTGKPISPATLTENFRPELEQGYAQLKGLVGRRYVEALNNSAVWAIQAGLRQFYKWKSAGDVYPLEELDGPVQPSDTALEQLEHLLASIRESRTIDGTAQEVDSGSEDGAPPQLVVSSPRRTEATSR